MKSHLEYTADDYNQDPDARGVYPISKIDATIISKLQHLIKKDGGDELAEIVDRWKHNGDAAILKMLNDYGEGLSVNISEDQDEGDVWLYVEIKDSSFLVRYIYNISKTQEYVDNRMCYNLMINKGPIPAQYAWYLDTKIKCFSPEERNKLYEELKRKLTKHNMCKFI
jgi:hypothetical protein